MKFNGFDNIPKNFWNKYIRNLTSENIQEIVNMCFNNSGVIERIEAQEELINISGKYFKASLTSFEVYEWKKFAFKRRLKDNANELYVEYMYQLFGEEYITEYFEIQYKLENLEQEVAEAKQKLSDAQIQCGLAISEYCKAHA